MNMDELLRKQEPKKPIKGSINPDKTQQYSCPICGRLWWEWNFVTEYCDVCGQRIDLSDGGFANTIDEVMAHIGIDMSTKSDFSPTDITPDAFLGKYERGGIMKITDMLILTEDGKYEKIKQN